MARTSKSRGATPFQMRSGNNGTPYKFLGKLVKGIGGLAGKAAKSGLMGPVAMLGSNLLNRGGGGDPASGAAVAPGGSMIPDAAQMRMKKDMMGGTPMVKKDASYMKDASPYKAYKCGPSSPLKRAYLSKGLDAGMYDAISGKGTKKYGDIAKARAFTNMSKSIASATASAYSNSLRKAKKDWKKDKKFQKWLNRKEKGWKDTKRWGSVT